MSFALAGHEPAEDWGGADPTAARQSLLQHAVRAAEGGEGRRGEGKQAADGGGWEEFIMVIRFFLVYIFFLSIEKWFNFAHQSYLLNCSCPGCVSTWYRWRRRTTRRHWGHANARTPSARTPSAKTPSARRQSSFSPTTRRVTSQSRILISWCDCDTDTFSTLPKHQYEINLGNINVNTTIRL